MKEWKSRWVGSQDTSRIEISFGCPVDIELELDETLVRSAQQNVIWPDATWQVRKFKVMIMIRKRQVGTRRQLTDGIQVVADPPPIVGCLPDRWCQPWTN